MNESVFSLDHISEENGSKIYRWGSQAKTCGIPTHRAANVGFWVCSYNVISAEVLQILKKYPLCDIYDLAGAFEKCLFEMHRDAVWISQFFQSWHDIPRFALMRSSGQILVSFPEFKAEEGERERARERARSIWISIKTKWNNVPTQTCRTRILFAKGLGYSLELDWEELWPNQSDTFQ